MLTGGYSAGQLDDSMSQCMCSPTDLTLELSTLKEALQCCSPVVTCGPSVQAD